MTFQYFISKINWRQILIHFVAFWFFILSFQTLSYLHNIKLIKILQHSNESSLNKDLSDNGIKSSEFVNTMIWINVSGFFGLLIAGSISLAISIRRHWLWVNTLIAFIMIYIFNRLNFLGWHNLMRLVWYLCRTLNNSTFVFLFIGIIFLISGILMFSLKRTIRFIENYRMAAV